MPTSYQKEFDEEKVIQLVFVFITSMDIQMVNLETENEKLKQKLIKAQQELLSLREENLSLKS